MNLFAGKQKAWMGAIAAFLSALIPQVMTGQPIEVDAEVTAIANLAGELAISTVAAVFGYAITYLKTSRAADGTAMQFVRMDGTIVDTSGAPKGKVTLNAHWLATLLGFVVVLGSLGGCASWAARTGLTVAQQCYVAELGAESAAAMGYDFRAIRDGLEAAGVICAPAPDDPA